LDDDYTISLLVQLNLPGYIDCTMYFAGVEADSCEVDNLG